MVAASLSDTNPEFSLDSRQILEAFRLIGSLDGIRYNDLQEAFASVRNEQLREPLLKALADIFPKFDLDRSGHIDLQEFEKMLRSSTILEAAIHEMLETAGDAQ